MDTSHPTTHLLTRSRMAADLRNLGVAPGGILMVHVSLRALGWLVGGPDTVIHALLDALSPAGTVLMYISWEEWERSLVAGLETMPENYRAAYLAECPPFDPTTSRACRHWSILTEYLRTWPGAFRSNHPTASVAAVGPQAAWLTADHPLAYGYGAGTPFAKLCAVHGQVLLLGAPLNALTILHHAEHICKIPGKKIVYNQLPIRQGGQTTWVTFEEFDTTESIVPGESGEFYFTNIAESFIATGGGKTGYIGGAISHLFPANELTAYAVRWMEAKWGGRR